MAGERTELAWWRTGLAAQDPACGRGVKAVLERDSGDPCVPEVLRHDERGDRDPSGQVPAQPAALVPGQPGERRDESCPASMSAFV
jgi:hypothetical protein